MEKSNKRHLADLGLLLTALLWGGGFVAGKMSLTGSNPFAILFWRFGIAAVFCFFLFRKRILLCRRKTMLRAFLISVIQVVSLCLQLTGLQYTTSAKQSFLCTAYVAIVPFISWAAARKRPGLRAFIAGFLALCGIGLISLNGLEGVSLGDGLSICFSLGFAVQIVLISLFVDDDTEPMAFTFFQMLGSSVLSLLVCLALGKTLRVTGTEALLGVGYLALLNTLAAFLLQNVCQKYTSDTMAALLLSMESVFGFICSVLYYHETLSLKFALGCAACFAAILLNSWKGKREKTEQRESS